MSETPGAVEIPKRALFKAAEVCDIAKVQPYVLRSWETEFPGLGVSKAPGGPRTYRRVDVEQVLRIRHLLLVEGLTLAGARRRLQDESTPVAADAPLDELMGQNARERITDVKRGLRAILELLAGRAHAAEEFRLAPPPSSRSRAVAAVGRIKSARGKVAPAKHGASRSASAAKRKRA